MTAIEWTDVTWNPMRGCTRISPGCGDGTGGGCYAEGEAVRVNRCSTALGRPAPYDGLVKLVKRGDRTEARWTGKTRFAAEMLAKPLKMRKPRRIFVNSMSDLFHDGFSNEEIAAVFGVMAACPQHTFQILTKRPERMRAWFDWIPRQAWARDRWIEEVGDAEVACGESRGTRGASDAGVERAAVLAYARETHGSHVPYYVTQAWPLPNVHLGVSVENREHGVPRIDVLREVPAAVRFLSIEPILEDVGALNLDGIGWAIVGCESGAGMRPADIAWYRSIRDQCKAARVGHFLKQAVLADGITLGPGSHRKPGGGNVIGAPYLDGIQHLAMPTTSPATEAGSVGR